MALLRDTKARAKRIDLAYFKKAHPVRRWKRILCLLLPALGVAWVAFAAVRKDDRLYTSGELSPRHKMLDRQCAACHTAGWGERYVDPAAWQAKLDAACLNCHDGPVHHANATSQVSGAKGAEKSAQCSLCHLEHEGSHRLSAVADRHCIGCHADLKTGGAEAHPATCPVGADHGISRVIRSFQDGHPEFALLAKKAKDPSAVKFNHHVHLGSGTAGQQEQIQADLKNKLAGRPGIEAKGTDGRLTMACAYCHKSATPGGAYLAPVHYEAHCADCHALKAGAADLPHESPQIVRDFLRSRLVLKDGAEAGEALAAELAQVEEPLYNSAPQKCMKCHEGKASDEVNGPLPVLKPTGLRPGAAGNEGAPRRWMTHAVFNHDTHRTLSCVECHKGADASKDTADLLMPDRATCLKCHVPSTGIASTCVTCHTYHDKTRPRGALKPLGIGEVVK